MLEYMLILPFPVWAGNDMETAQTGNRTMKMYTNRKYFLSESKE